MLSPNSLAGLLGFTACQQDVFAIRIARLFPVVDKSGTSYSHLLKRLTRPTDSQQVVPTSLISFASC